MPDLFSRGTVTSKGSMKQRRQRTGGRYGTTDFVTEPVTHDHTQSILTKIREIEKAAAKGDTDKHIETALKSICSYIKDNGSAYDASRRHLYDLQDLKLKHDVLIEAMSGEDYSWGRSSIHAIASATSSLIVSELSTASGPLEKKMSALRVFETLYILAGVIFSSDDKYGFIEVSYIGGFVSSSIFIYYALNLADVCAANNALIDIINSRYLLLNHSQKFSNERTESTYYEQAEMSWAVGSAASRYKINASTVFRILPEALTMVVSDAIVDVFCQSMFALERQDMETMSFFDAVKNLDGKLCRGIIGNMVGPRWLPARYVLTPMVASSAIKSSLLNAYEVKAGKSVALFMEREQDYSDEKTDIKWTKLGVEKEIIYPVLAFNLIMLVVLVAALYCAVSYNDTFANAQIDVTSFLSLILVFEGLAFAGFTSVYRENWSLYWMFQFKVHYNDISKILQHKDTTSIKILRGILSNRHIYSKLIQPSRSCWIGEGTVEADNYLSSDVLLWSYYECGVIELGTNIPGGGYRAIMVKIIGEMLTMEHIELSGLSSGQAHVRYSAESDMTDVTLGFLQSDTENMPIGAAKENVTNSTAASNAEICIATDVTSRGDTTTRPIVDQHLQRYRG
ncbi:hypothetical protein K450DRAFT_271485 [Umbelopsis ramanniana AG]|uniref:Uncharacterized protein n=1 Tax=Umbelopsis ramanniana AG TaxID=1314678 RepID=A0AAD5HFC6_UMBRA|nr:uncharacterized protein K450DRAFT_271485 [Umbelopsis ramanniana AG]KAI8579903.1 hypothetical protein K450DRAFT_271485 [Umbelopsis ramanniana AG]